MPPTMSSRMTRTRRYLRKRMEVGMYPSCCYERRKPGTVSREPESNTPLSGYRLTATGSLFSGRILQRHARIDQSHAVGAVGREIGRLDAVVARQRLDPAHQRIEARDLERDAHARRADRLDAPQRALEPARACRRVGEREQRASLPIRARMRTGRAQALHLGRGDAHVGEIAPLRVDRVAKLDALHRERMPDQRPAEHQRDDDGTDRDDALLALGEAVPPGAHHFAPPASLPMRIMPS